MDLKTRIGKMTLANPVMAASGTFGCGEEYADLFDVNALGAIVTKTITIEPRTGNAPPRVAETASGMLNSIGLENKGLEDFLAAKVPFLKTLKTKVVVSIAGRSAQEFARLARRLEETGCVDGLELNLSCPNVRYGKARMKMFAQDARAVGAVTAATRRATRLTLIPKLSPNVTDIAEIATAAQDAGADAISLINTFPAMALDIRTRLPLLGNVTGGLSGPAIKPIALKMVWDVSRAVEIPLIGAGGIMDYRDAVEFLLCGASAVQVGTANFVDGKAALSVVDGLRRYLEAHKIDRVSRLVGSARLPREDGSTFL